MLYCHFTKIIFWLVKVLFDSVVITAVAAVGHGAYTFFLFLNEMVTTKSSQLSLNGILNCKPVQTKLSVTRKKFKGQSWTDFSSPESLKALLW